MSEYVYDPETKEVTVKQPGVGVTIAPVVEGETPAQAAARVTGGAPTYRVVGETKVYDVPQEVALKAQREATHPTPPPKGEVITLTKTPTGVAYVGPKEAVGRAIETRELGEWRRELAEQEEVTRDSSEVLITAGPGGSGFYGEREAVRRLAETGEPRLGRAVIQTHISYEKAVRSYERKLQASSEEILWAGGEPVEAYGVFETVSVTPKFGIYVDPLTGKEVVDPDLAMWIPEQRAKAPLDPDELMFVSQKVVDPDLALRKTVYEKVPAPTPLRAPTLEERAEYTRQREEEVIGVPPEKEFVRGLLAPGEFAGTLQRDKDWQKQFSERPYYYGGAFVSEQAIFFGTAGLIRGGARVSSAIRGVAARVRPSRIPTTTPRGQVEMDVALSRSSFLTTKELAKTQIKLTAYPKTTPPPHVGPPKVTRILPPSKVKATPKVDVTKLTEYGKVKGLAPEFLSMRERGFDITKVKVEPWQAPTKQYQYVLTKTGYDLRPMKVGAVTRSSEAYFKKADEALRRDTQIEYKRLAQEQKRVQVKEPSIEPTPQIELVRPIKQVKAPTKPLVTILPPTKTGVFPTRGPAFPRMQPGTDIWSMATRVIPSKEYKRSQYDIIRERVERKRIIREKHLLNTKTYQSIMLERKQAYNIRVQQLQQAPPMVTKITAPRVTQVTKPRVTRVTAPKTTPVTTPRTTPIVTPRPTPVTAPVTTPRTTTRITPATTSITTQIYTPIKVSRMGVSTRPPSTKPIPSLAPPPFIPRPKKRRRRDEKPRSWSRWRYRIFRNIPKRPPAPQRPPTPTPSKRRIL